METVTKAVEGCAPHFEAKPETNVTSALYASPKPAHKIPSNLLNIRHATGHTILPDTSFCCDLCLHIIFSCLRIISFWLIIYLPQSDIRIAIQVKAGSTRGGGHSKA
jgi:hypothetical protein